MLEPAADDCFFVRFVEYGEWTFVFRLGCIFEVFDVFGDNFAVGDEVTLAVDHVGDHHDLVKSLVRKLERLLGDLNIVGHDDRFSTLDSLLNNADFDLALGGADGVP